jgi:hypothetical protein
MFVRQSYLLWVYAEEEMVRETMAITIVKDSPIGWCGRRKFAIAAGILMFFKFKILSANYKIPNTQNACVYISFPGEGK